MRASPAGLHLSIHRWIAATSTSLGALPEPKAQSPKASPMMTSGSISRRRFRPVAEVLRVEFVDVPAVVPFPKRAVVRDNDDRRIWEGPFSEHVGAGRRV